MALLTPMIGKIAGCVLDHSDPNAAELPGAPKRFAGCAGMFGRSDGGPVCRAKGNMIDLHQVLRKLDLYFCEFGPIVKAYPPFWRIFCGHTHGIQRLLQNS